MLPFHKTHRPAIDSPKGNPKTKKTSRILFVAPGRKQRFSIYMNPDQNSRSVSDQAKHPSDVFGAESRNKKHASEIEKKGGKNQTEYERGKENARFPSSTCLPHRNRWI
jgi:hypothetical protein